MLGWIANIILIYSWWTLGYQKRHALICGAAGSLVWFAIGVQKEMWDLCFIELVLACLGVRAWMLWRKNINVTTPPSSPRSQPEPGTGD